MQKFNYHTHTYRCGHADYNMTDEDYVISLIQNGFERMAFSDHTPQKEYIDKRLYMRMDYSSLDGYLESIELLKQKYKGIIEIQSGLEIEYLPGQEKNLMELKGKVDKVILGQHFVYNEDKSDLQTLRVNIFTDEEIIRYANYIKEAMEIGLADVVAHPDLFMLSSDVFGQAEAEATRIICKAAEETKTPLEINLAEIAGHISDPTRKIHYPVKDFWQIAAEYDVNVVYGIDAHNRGQIDLYEQSVNFCKELFGKEIIDKLNFIDLK
ncbi:MAG: PHP domain-containing protein [Clostridia bacterium]|nr:PHP domain-containing protein [Clostridia bacterium]